MVIKVKGQIPLMISLKRESYTDRQIGKKLGLSHETIRRNLRDNMIDYGDYIPPYFNINFFEDINSEEKAYWLGFLYGDGSIRKHGFCLGLKVSDIKHLEKLKMSTQSKNKIGYNEKLCWIQLSSKKLYDDLIKLGCVPNKSHKDLHIPNIPNNFIRHFIRGLFDADGSVCLHKTIKHYGTYYYPQIGITGNKILIDEIIDFCYNNQVFKYKNKVSKNKTSKNTYQTAYVGKYAMKFLDYIYSECTMYLNRKYNLYNKFKIGDQNTIR